MDLIYLNINAVTEHLPDTKKEEAALDLRTKIDARLPSDPSAEDIKKVLQEMGNPYQQAKNYDTRQRYLIGPDYYDGYLAMLKLVVGILITVMAIITVLIWIINPPGGGIVQFIIDLITGIVGGAVQAAAWVTVIFVILERTGTAVPPLHQNWTIVELTKAKPDRLLIKRSDSFISVFFTIIFAAILYFRPELFSFFYKSGDAWVTIPFLNLERLQDFMPFILIIALLELTVAIWQLITRRWNLSLAIANAVKTITSMGLSLVMLWNRAIINPAFSTEVSQRVSFSAASIERSIEIGVWVIIGIIIVASLIDLITPFVKISRK